MDPRELENGIHTRKLINWPEVANQHYCHLLMVLNYAVLVSAVLIRKLLEPGGRLMRYLQLIRCVQPRQGVWMKTR